MSDYIPRADEKLQAWAGNFSRLVLEDPEKYHVTAEAAAGLNAAEGAFAAALVVARTPAMRTIVTVAEKNFRRRELLRLVRGLAMQIKHDRRVGDAEKIQLGLRPGRRFHGRIQPPGSFPVLAVVSATPGVHMIRYSDVLTLTSRAKPAGTMALELRREIDDFAGGNADRARLVGFFSRQSIEVNLAQADRGRVARYWGRWVTARGEAGPWSNGVAFTVT